MNLVVFEGSQWTRFLPLSLSRPVFTLTTGSSILLDKQIRHIRPDRLTLWVRPELEGYVRTRVIPKLGIPAEVNGCGHLLWGPRVLSQ